jgi:hypothetical protein
MANSNGSIRFEATLQRPATNGKAVKWTFLVVPPAASAKLATRNAVTVEGTLNGQAFRATLEPDGRKSHWLKVENKLCVSARAAVGDIVTLEIRRSARELEPRVPADLRKALAAAPKARAVWSDITTVARRDWVAWIVSARKPQTRARRVATACEMLAGGKRRICCFDRSGFYGGNASAPQAAQQARRSRVIAEPRRLP